jgi:hypothetical protein
MARIRSTAKLITPTSSEARQETIPISEAMKASSLSKHVQELPRDMPSKPSYIEIGHSTLREKDLQSMKKLSYFSSKINVRLPGNETTRNPGKDKVVVYKSFFKAGLRLPMYKMIAMAMQHYEVYMNHLTPNAIIRLSAFIWVVRSQGVAPMPVLSAECMICTIKQRSRVRQASTITSVATTSRIVRIKLARSLHIEPSGMETR